MIKVNDECYIEPTNGKKFKVLHINCGGYINYWSYTCDKCGYKISDDDANKVFFIMTGHGK